MIDEPDAVGAAAKDMAFAMHLTGEDGEQHRLSMSCANLQRHPCLGGEVDVVTPHLDQTFFADGVEETCRGAVVEELRRLLWRILQLDLDRMPLTRPNATSIRAEFEALLRVRDDDMLQLVARERPARFGTTGEQRSNLHPSGGIERDMRCGWFMPQHEAEELAGAGGLGGRHASDESESVNRLVAIADAPGETEVSDLIEQRLNRHVVAGH